jgi:hypothetical protein
MVAKRMLVGFLTLIILFADSGQMIYAHTCLQSKHTSVSLYSPAGCCIKIEKTKSCCAKKAVAEKKNCALGKMPCCSVSAKYVKQSFPSNEIKLAETADLKEAIFELPLFSVYPLQIAQKTFFPPVPLLQSKDDIRFTGVFRI